MWAANESYALKMNIIVILCKMPPIKDFAVNIHKKNDCQNVRQWNGFHVVISRTPPQPSAIGYTPFIRAPPTEKSVVYTLLVNTDTLLN